MLLMSQLCGPTAVKCPAPEGGRAVRVCVRAIGRRAWMAAGVTREGAGAADSGKKQRETQRDRTSRDHQRTHV